MTGSDPAIPKRRCAGHSTYHWFDRDRAHAEIARVLRAGGTFAPIWNLRDDRVAWVAELGRIAHLGDNAVGVVGRYEDFGPAFTPIELGEFTHHTTLTPDDAEARTEAGPGGGRVRGCARRPSAGRSA
jgi:SAM-dependent methyltransferase